MTGGRAADMPLNVLRPQLSAAVAVALFLLGATLGIPRAVRWMRSIQAARQQRQEHDSKLLLRSQRLLELFRLHDLDKDGVVTFDELVKLNQKISYLHFGKDGLRKRQKELDEKYRQVMEWMDLDHNGVITPDEFSAYQLRFLDGIDPEINSQLVILERFVEEAGLTQDIPDSEVAVEWRRRSSIKASPE